MKKMLIVLAIAVMFGCSEDGGNPFDVETQKSTIEERVKAQREKLIDEVSEKVVEKLEGKLENIVYNVVLTAITGEIHKYDSENRQEVYKNEGLTIRFGKAEEAKNQAEFQSIWEKQILAIVQKIIDEEYQKYTVELSETINSESLIDKLVERINKKQVGK